MLFIHGVHHDLSAFKTAHTGATWLALAYTSRSSQASTSQ